MKVLIFIGIVTNILYASNTLYDNNCKQCHGEYGEKVAFGRSMIIKDMNKSSFISAIEGYKNNTYGKQLKYFMQSYVKDLNQKDILDIYNYLQKQK